MIQMLKPLPKLNIIGAKANRTKTYELGCITSYEIAKMVKNLREIVLGIVHTMV